jgi:uncharacterized protein (UPF0332 family)
MSLENLENAGEIALQPVSKSEIQDLLSKAERKLKDSQFDSISSETRLELAYTVILTCAMIALRSRGYRVTSLSATHYIAIETLRYTLNLEDKKVGYYQSLRALRHRDIYGSVFEIGEKELNRAIKESSSLLCKVKEWLSRNYPDLV